LIEISFKKTKMIFTLATCALLVSLAAIPPTHAADINVIVGGDGLTYNPQTVNAVVGDNVIFEFHQKNHTATQSTLESPCTQKPNGFNSGFVPVAADATEFPKAKFAVVDTNPVWVYCAQATHCQQGMVFAINPADKFEQFKAAAQGGAAGVSSAATPTSTGAPTPSSGTTNDHKVVVGGPGKLVYDPSNITAQAGDTVTFEFRQKNHTATQSTFASPCRALTLTSTSGQVGFDSGFMAVADGATTFPTYTIQVNDTQPIWVYCKQTGHCGQGMVFSVNAVESGANNFGAFQEKAKQQNGSGASTSSSAPSATPSTGAGVSTVVSRAGMTVVLIAVGFGLFF
jgi:plastocyanin